MWGGSKGQHCHLVWRQTPLSSWFFCILDSRCSSIFHGPATRQTNLYSILVVKISYISCLRNGYSHAHFSEESVWSSDICAGGGQHYPVPLSRLVLWRKWNMLLGSRGWWWMAMSGCEWTLTLCILMYFRWFKQMMAWWAFFWALISVLCWRKNALDILKFIEPRSADSVHHPLDGGSERRRSMGAQLFRDLSTQKRELTWLNYFADIKTGKFTNMGTQHDLKLSTDCQPLWIQPKRGQIGVTNPENLTNKRWGLKQHDAEFSNHEVVM